MTLEALAFGQDDLGQVLLSLAMLTFGPAIHALSALVFVDTGVFEIILVTYIGMGHGPVTLNVLTSLPLTVYVLMALAL